MRLKGLDELVRDSQEFISGEDLAALVVGVDSAQSQANDQVDKGRLLRAIDL